MILDVQMKGLLCRRVTVIVICRLRVNRVTGRKGCDQLCERTNIKSLRRGICQSASLGKLQLEWVGGGRGRYSIQAWLGVHHYFKHANTHTHLSFWKHQNMFGFISGMTVYGLVQTRDKKTRVVSANREHMRVAALPTSFWTGRHPELIIPKKWERMGAGGGGPLTSTGTLT